MIEKIQNLIEDNTSMDITHNQIVMGLTVIVAIVVFIVFFMFSSGGPKKESDTYVPKPPTKNMPVHIPGQN